MTRAGVVALALGVLLAGCGQRHERTESELTFERLTDTTRLTAGAPLIRDLEPYRAGNGAVGVRGSANVPDGVRFQITIFRRGTQQMLGRVQVVMRDHRFESPPVLGTAEPLPPGVYRFEVFTLFNPAWQTEDVLRLTDHGRALRGPGVTRDRVGGVAFFYAVEHPL